MKDKKQSRGRSPAGAGPGPTARPLCEVSLLVRGAAAAQLPPSQRRTLRRQLGRAMRAAGLDRALVCLSLSDDTELLELNRTYADEDHATDVLSFAQREQRDDSADGLPQLCMLPPGQPEPLGDIVISIETAQRQASAQQHPLLYELLHLSVHGLCHLLGYDHRDATEERVMFGYEAELREQARGRAQVLAVTAPPWPPASNQHTNQRINQHTNQRIDQPIDQPVGKPAGPAASRRQTGPAKTSKTSKTAGAAP